MKRLFLAIIAGILLSQCLFAQTYQSKRRTKAFTEFKFGRMNPVDTDTGNLYGISTGRRIDNRLFWGAEFNYFQSSFRQETTIADSVVGGIRFSEKKLELEFDTRIMMFMFILTYERPFSDQSPLYLRGAGGLGWELIWNNEDNFLEGFNRDRFFHGLGWQLSGGVGMVISNTGVLFFDIFYNNSFASRNQDRDEEGLPVWDQINISGLGIKVGVNILGLGFFR